MRRAVFDRKEIKLISDGNAKILKDLLSEICILKSLLTFFLNRPACL